MRDKYYKDPYDDEVIIIKKEKPKIPEFSPNLLFSSALVGNSDYLDVSFDKFYHSKLPQLEKNKTLEITRN